MKPTKNITITVDKALFEAAKRHPEVRRTSLSAYVAALLKREVQPEPDAFTDTLMAAIDEAAKQSKATWTWNRDEIYER